ncbi:MAG: hypothetical protein KDF59_05875 [Nitrosomonas sp.]|nr:hypothetical protein [Nitrosomonas sp.]
MADNHTLAAAPLLEQEQVHSNCTHKLEACNMDAADYKHNHKHPDDDGDDDHDGGDHGGDGAGDVLYQPQPQMTHPAVYLMLSPQMS